MPKFNPDNLNIHELTVEEPEKEVEPTDVSFDPNDIFDQSDFRALQRMSLDGDGRGNGTDFLMPNAALAMIDRNRLPPMSEYTKSKIKERVVKGYPQSLAWASYIFPDFMKVPDEILEKAIKNGKEEMEQYKNSNDWRHFAEPVAWLTLIGHRPELSQEENIKIEECLKSQKNGGYLIEMGAAMSIIYPDYPLRYPKEKSDEMQSFLKKCVKERWGGGEWYMFSAMAKLVADKCREVNARRPESKLTQEIPNIPQQKEF